MAVLLGTRMHASDLADLKDGDYSVAMTHEAGDPGVQFPHSPIPAKAYVPVGEGHPVTLLLRFSEQGKEVMIFPGGTKGHVKSIKIDK